MGWGNGDGKKEVLDPAGGDVIFCGSDGEHPFRNKLVFIDVSGLAHKASKKDAATVVREGTSEKQQDYLRKRITSVAAEGGVPVLVLDGRAYPPKLGTRAERRLNAAASCTSRLCPLLCVRVRSGRDMAHRSRQVHHGRRVPGRTRAGRARRALSCVARGGRSE